MRNPFLLLDDHSRQELFVEKGLECVVVGVEGGTNSDPVTVHFVGRNACFLSVDEVSEVRTE